MSNQIVREKGKTKSKPYPIVAIGASAGGLEAITQLLKNLAPDTGMAYVYIQHLDPNHESMLSAILAKSTKMKVVQAAHLVPIEPNHLFVIPPDRNMSIIDGVIKLNDRMPKPAINMPIDQFFLSLAEKQNEGAIGVLLSGTGTDGTIGLRAIKAAGGFTFAQDESARFHSMPKSAIVQGVVDIVLPPEAIAEELQKLSNHTDLLALIATSEANSEDNFHLGTNSVSDTEQHLDTILELIKNYNGVDFFQYKRSTIRRRIIRRMLLQRIETQEDYVEYLKQKPEEIGVLYQDLLIHVTTFFRDSDTIEYVKETILPQILRAKPAGETLRIWVPACSTGEEAYSLAMIVMEVLGDKIDSNPIQIFATDISEVAIAKARLGLYSKNELINISPERLQRFFLKVDGSYRIHKSVREKCVFAPHNLFREPPFSRLDLISCCNLLIYLDPELQKKAISIFYYSLKPHGNLILGKSETIGSSSHLFFQLEKKIRVYARTKDVAASNIPEISSQVAEHKNPNIAFNMQVPDSGSETGKLVDQLLLGNYVPPTVLVNEKLDILQFRGATGIFLEPASGKASLNLLKMARPGLGFEVRNAVNKANKQKKTIKKDGLQIRINDAVRLVSIEVVPLVRLPGEKLFLVIFLDNQVKTESAPGSSSFNDEDIRKLQEELNTVREDMRSVLEDHEAGIEELQSANEEIISSNEELQSVNEELQTSKEEVESTNEELITINTELQVRNQQLQEAYDYSGAIVGTVREAVVILDKHLRVKTANNSFYSIFNVRESQTEGELIYELGNNQWDIPQLRQLLYDVVLKNMIFNDFVVRHDFQGIGKKVMLLNARKLEQKVHNEELILLAIDDITSQEEAARIIRDREQLFRNMADNAPVMIWLTNSHLVRVFVNHTWLSFTGRRLEQETGQGWTERLHPDDKENVLRFFASKMEAKESFQVEYRLLRHDNTYRWVLDVGKPTFDDDSVFTGYIGSSNDIHDKKISTQELEISVQKRTWELNEANKELSRSNSELQQFAYVASHDLQEPLRKIITFSDKLTEYKESLPDTAKNFIEKITSSSHRMTRLIDDLLNFSRISRSNHRFSRTNLNDIVKDTLGDFELIVLQKKAEIYCDNLPVIHAIPVQMEQLFHNLISNALKFSKTGIPPVINISSRIIPVTEKPGKNLKQPAPYVEIIVADNGIGFNPEFAEQIFTIFQRLNSKYEYPGTGIGLALCRKIAMNHDGEMFAESEPNQGARFHIILPVKQNVKGRHEI